MRNQFLLWIDTLMEEIQPLFIANIESENREKSLLIAVLALTYSSRIKQLSIETLMKEIKPVVFKKNEFENGHMSKLVASIWQFWRSRNPMQTTKSIVLGRIPLQAENGRLRL